MKLRDKPNIVSVREYSSSKFAVVFDSDIWFKHGGEFHKLEAGCEGFVFKDEAHDELAVVRLLNDLMLQGRLRKTHG